MDKEMILYKRKIKETIEALIKQNRINEAKELIAQYRRINKEDIDIYSMEGIIYMMEGQMERAESILEEGILKDSTNNDLLYNIANLYKITGKIDRTTYFYRKLYSRTRDENEKKEIEEELSDLKASIKNRILIGSPIHQKPQILKEFLNSLMKLKKEGLEIVYFFIDDNINEESSEMLNQFSIKESNVVIKKSNYNDIYVCDDETHFWKENLIWKVAGFKNDMIQYAKEYSYDYLFFVDSDLVLHSETLIHLVSTGKDIISEIFWTKWNTEYMELPQVWLQDSYVQYRTERGENLNDAEKKKRHMEFINELRIPGIYEVGGLGACTLISKYAIDKGVNFSEIKNISFSGEDRHFCIRAVAIGLGLYVDTHYPAYHIYRESDLERISN